MNILEIFQHEIFGAGGLLRPLDVNNFLLTPRVD
jgi:hypothetical protein